MELILEERSSRGLVKDYYSQTPVSKKYQESPYLHKTLLDMMKKDPILFSAVSLTVDLVTYKGYSFLGKNQREIDRAKKIFNEELDFDQVIDNVLWQLIPMGDAYMEIRWNPEKSKVMELHPLETTEMAINYTESGDIIGFVQKVEGKSEVDYPQFAPDEIIYFRHFWIGSQVYSHAPFESIARSYATKVYANDYLQSIFINLPPKIIYFLKSANDKQRGLFIENLLRAKTNPNIDIIAQGDAFESKLLQVGFDSGLIEVLEYLRKEILMITRVPPHWIGILDGANRGIGENVVIPYETKIKKIQQKIESQINRELLPKLGLSNVTFKWNSISLMDERTVVEIMNFLKSQGFDGETIIDYARQRGIDLRQGAFIEKEESNNQTLQNNTALSRMRDNAKSNKMGDNLDEKGVSDEGKEKIQEKKVSA